MSLIDRVKNMIISPNTEWDVISSETPDTGKMITTYVLPLAGLAAIAAFIGFAFIGIDAGLFRMKGFDWGLYSGINIIVSAVLGIFISAFVIDALAPSFSSEKNMGRSVQLVTYAYTPVWLGGLLTIIPSLSFIGALFGVYGLYLLYIGFPKLKKTPTDKHLPYFIVSLLVVIAVYFIIGTLMRAIMRPIIGIPEMHYGRFF